MGDAIVKLIRCSKGHRTFCVSMGDPDSEFNAYTTECPHDANGLYAIGHVPRCGEDIVEWDMTRARVVS